MYPSTSVFIAVGQLAIAILVMFSYPMQVHPCRNCLDKIFQLGYQGSDSALAGDDEDGVPAVDEHGLGEMSTFKHAVLTVAIIVSGFSVAYFVDNLQMGESLRVAMDFMRAQPYDSSLVRRLHRVYDCFVYPTRPILLEANKERSGDREVVKSFRAGSRHIRDAGVRILVRKFCSDWKARLTEASP